MWKKNQINSDAKSSINIIKVYMTFKFYFYQYKSNISDDKLGFKKSVVIANLTITIHHSTTIFIQQILSIN